jgi:hypothetical protein
MTFVYQAARNITSYSLTLRYLASFVIHTITWDGIRRRPREACYIILALPVVMSTDSETLRVCSSDTAHDEVLEVTLDVLFVFVCILLGKLWRKEEWSLWVFTANICNFWQHVYQLWRCMLIEIWGSECHQEGHTFNWYSLDIDHKQARILRAVKASTPILRFSHWA